MHAQREVSFLVMGHAKTDTGKEREIKGMKKRPVRELKSPPRGFMVVERAHGKVNQESCSPLLSTLNSVSFFFFFLVQEKLHTCQIWLVSQMLIFWPLFG